jgi:hypothetical protein
VLQVPSAKNLVVRTLLDQHTSVSNAYSINDPEMGAVGVAAADGGPMMSLEMGKSLIVRMNRLEQQLSHFQAHVQASFVEQRDHFDHKFRTVKNNIRCFGGTINGSLLIQQ